MRLNRVGLAVVMLALLQAVPALAADCAHIYSVETTALDAGNYVQLREKDITNADGTLLTTIPNAEQSAALGISANARYLWVVSRTTLGPGVQNLRRYDTVTNTWTLAGSFTNTTGFPFRMAITASGTGYVMTNAGQVWSFTTPATGASAFTGPFTWTAVPAGAPGFNTAGDFFADNAGNLFMLSSSGGTSVDLWFINTTTNQAVFLGATPLTNAGQYAGYSALGAFVYGKSLDGTMIQIDLAALTAVQIGSAANRNSADLASCHYPTLQPSLAASKSVQKVAGSSGSVVQPGDTLEYTITVRNTGNVAAGNATFADSIPAGTTYLAGSTTLNGAAVADVAGAMPFVTARNINSPAQSAGVVLVDSTPVVTNDREAQVRFRVTVNSPFTLSPSQVSNQGTVAAGNTSALTQTDDPAVGGVADPTITPIFTLSDLRITKTNTPGVNNDVDQPSDTVTSGTASNYTLVVANNGPSAANGAVVTDPAPSGMTCTTASCTATGGATCPAPTGAALVAALQGSGATIPVLPNAGTVTITLSCNVTASGL